MNFNKLKFLGYALFTLSCLILCIVFALPFFIKDVTKMITVNTILLIVSEGSFALSIMILGKEFWQKIKAYFNSFWEKVKSWF